MKWLDRIASIAVIVAVAVFLFIAARNNFFTPKPQLQANPQKELAGTTIALPGYSFASGHDSLLLVVSTTCHFCQDSLPFYKQLSEKALGKLDLIAVLPEPESIAVISN